MHREAAVGREREEPAVADRIAGLPRAGHGQRLRGHGVSNGTSTGEADPGGFTTPGVRPSRGLARAGRAPIDRHAPWEQAAGDHLVA